MFFFNVFTSIQYCILCWIQYYICYFLWNIIRFHSVVCKDPLSSVLFGSLQEALWLHLHFSTTSITPKPLQPFMLTERLPVGLMSSVVAPEKPAPNTMGPKEVRRKLSRVLPSPHIQSLWVIHCFLFVYVLTHSLQTLKYNNSGTCQIWYVCTVNLTCLVYGWLSLRKWEFGEIPGSLSSANYGIQSHLNPLSFTSHSCVEHLVCHLLCDWPVSYFLLTRNFDKKIVPN